MLAVIAAACPARSRQTPDDTVVVLIESPMTTGDPRYTISNYDATLSRLVSPGLFAMDTANMVPRLDLASKIEQVDDLTWDATIRDDAKFSDGNPVTAEDVAETFRSVYKEHSDSLWHNALSQRYSKVEPIAPKVVRFHLLAPLATIRSDLEFGIVSFHGSNKGEKLPNGDVIGAGPYAIRELTSTHALLETNPYYYGAKPHVPNVEIRFVRDAAARILMLVGGSADLIQNGVRLDLVDEIAERPRVHIESAPGVLLSYLMMNNDDPILRDVRVRKAIAYALDRRAIIDAKFQGRAVLATGLVAPSHWAYNGNVARYDHDLARAKQLLDEAGYKDPDGDGPLPRFHLVYKTSSDAFRAAVARVIAAQLGDIGIDVEVRAYEFATFFADIKRGNFQLGSMQTTPITDPDYYYAYFHSSRIPSPQDPDANNRWRYRNTLVDKLTYDGRHEPDQARRKAIYDEVQRQIAEDIPIVPLWHEDNVVLTNVSITGYRIIPTARLNGLLELSKVASPE
jgi:peptide/nickel transport system substrate-binding protein